MNPLSWKREHKIAFLCAMAIGAIIGTAIGLREVVPYGYNEIKFWCEPGYLGVSNCNYIAPGYWALVIMWSCAGAVFGASIVYIRQLLRA